MLMHVGVQFGRPLQVQAWAVEAHSSMSETHVKLYGNEKKNQIEQTKTIAHDLRTSHNTIGLTYECLIFFF